MSKRILKSLIILFAVVACVHNGVAQAQVRHERPYIWVTADDRPAMLSHISGDPRAAALKKQLHEKADSAGKNPGAEWRASRMPSRMSTR